MKINNTINNNINENTTNNRDCDMQAEGYMQASYMSTSDNMYGYPFDNQMMGETYPGVVCPPIYECPKETVCHRYICHEVPHDCYFLLDKKFWNLLKRKDNCIIVY